MRTHIAKGLKVVLFFAVGIIILLLVYQRQDKAYKAECALKGISNTDCSLIDKIMLDISNANYGWLILIMIFFMITNIIRALRWKMMFKAIGYSPSMLNLFGTVMINYLANLGVPRSGEVIRAGLLSNYEDIPLEKVLGTIFTDRIFDVIMLFIVIVLAMFFGGSEFITYLNDNIDLSSKINSFLSHPVLVISVILLSIISLWLVWKNRSKALESRVGKKIRSLFVGFSDGVQSVRGVSSIPLFIFYTVAIWVLYYLMTYLAFFSFTATSGLGPIAGLVVFVFGSLGIVIPTPGGMGSYHYLVGEGLALYGVNGIDAFSFANIVFFSINIFINILFGLAALIYLPLYNKER